MLLLSPDMSSQPPAGLSTQVIGAQNVQKTGVKVVVDPAAAVPSSEEFKNGFFRRYKAIEMNTNAMSNIMKNIETRPTTLGEQMRANTFPEIIRDIMVGATKHILI